MLISNSKNWKLKKIFDNSNNYFCSAFVIRSKMSFFSSKSIIAARQAIRTFSKLFPHINSIITISPLGVSTRPKLAMYISFNKQPNFWLAFEKWWLRSASRIKVHSVIRIFRSSSGVSHSRNRFWNIFSWNEGLKKRK